MSNGKPEAEAKAAAKDQLHHPALRVFFHAIVFAGVGAVVISSYDLCRHPVGWQWMILAGLCLLTGSFSIKIPGVNSKISIGDTFYFTNVILYGPSAGVLTAALDGLLGSIRARSRHRRLEFAVFNMSAMAWCALAGSWVFFHLLGQLPLSQRPPVSYREIIFPVAILGFIQYLLNSGTVAAIVALETRKSFYSIWKDSFLWTSITYLAGAAVAALAAVYSRIVGPEMLGVIVPVIVAVYYTYKVYLDKVLELNKVYLNTVESLAMAIDAKDQITHGHVRRVQIFASGLAKAAGMRDEGSLRWMEAAALLHDIGKLAIPEYILNKPGKLTRAEFNKVMVHPVVGSDILSSINFPYDVARDVRQHHENWDGSGYPDGLKGTDISLGARILAIVDTYDALTSDRPYRSAVSRDEAMAILRSKAGTFYDPELVQQFDEILDLLLGQVQVLETQQGSVDGKKAIHDVKHPPQETPERHVKAPGVFQDIVSTHREVSALYDLARTLGSTLNLEETLPVIASKIAKLVPSTTCVIYLLSAEKEVIVAEYVSGANQKAFQGHSMDLGQNLSGWVAANNHPAINADPVFDIAPLRPFLDVDLRNALVYPLYSEARCLGAFSLYGAEGLTFTDDHVRIMEVVVRQAARAIQNAIKYEETQVDALTDPLTSLPNSRYLDVYFERELEKAKHFRFPLVVLAMDLDGFKAVNDRFGHHVGDMMLLEVAKVLNRSVRASDVVIRYGGDEFLGIVSQTACEEVSLLAKRIQREVDAIRLEFRPGEFARVGISVGMASFPEDGDSLEVLLQTADQAMYQNKQSRARSPENVRRIFELVRPAEDQKAG